MARYEISFHFNNDITRCHCYRACCLTIAETESKGNGMLQSPSVFPLQELFSGNQCMTMKLSIKTAVPIPQCTEDSKLTTFPHQYHQFNPQ